MLLSCLLASLAAIVQQATGHPAPVTQFHFSFLRFIQRRSGHHKTVCCNAGNRLPTLRLHKTPRALQRGLSVLASSISATIRRAITRLTSLFTKTRLLCPVLRRVFMFLSSSPSTTTAVAVYTLDFSCGRFSPAQCFSGFRIDTQSSPAPRTTFARPFGWRKAPIRMGFFPKRLLQAPVPSILRAAPQHTNSSSRHTARRLPNQSNPAPLSPYSSYSQIVFPAAFSPISGNVPPAG